MGNEAMEPETSLCAECGATFQCGARSGSCWCAAFPAAMPLEPDHRCLCPACLPQAVARRIADLLSGLGHEEALALASRHAGGGLLEHVDYTVEGGSFVFSSWYLLKQGACCGKGCRNCPYPRGAGS